MNKKPIYKRAWFIGLIIVILIGAFACGGGEDDTSDNSSNSGGSQPQAEKKIQYKKVSINTLLDALEKNPAKAKAKYADKNLAVVGIVTNIDSDASYIDIGGTGKHEYSMYSLQAYTQNDKQKKAILNFDNGTKVVIKGKITDVGEVMGYSMDMASIKKAK